MTPRILTLLLCALVYCPAQSAWPKLFQCSQVLPGSLPKVTFDHPITEEQRAEFDQVLGRVDSSLGETARPSSINVFVVDRPNSKVEAGLRSVLMPMISTSITTPVGYAFKSEHKERRDIWFSALLRVYLIEHIYNEVPKLRGILQGMMGSTQLRNVDQLDNSGFSGVRDFFPNFYGGAPFYDRARWAEAGRNIKLLPEVVKTTYAFTRWWGSTPCLVLDWLIPHLDLYPELVKAASDGRDQAILDLVPQEKEADLYELRRHISDTLMKHPILIEDLPEIFVKDVIAEVQHGLDHPKALRAGVFTAEELMNESFAKRVSDWKNLAEPK